MQPIPSQDQCHVANAICVRAVPEWVRTDLKTRQRLNCTRQLTKSRYSVEVTTVPKHAKVTRLGDRWPHLKMKAVGGLCHLSKLGIPLLVRPGSSLHRITRPSLIIRPPAVIPHHQPLVTHINKHFRGCHVCVEILQRFFRIRLRPKERGVAHVKHAGFVDLPWTLRVVGIREPNEVSHVICEIHVVTPEST